MKDKIDLLNKCPLFTGIESHELENLLRCLSAKEMSYKKDEFIFSVGESTTTVGIVLSGRVHVLQEDFWGNRTILTDLREGNLFGEAFSCSEIEKLPVSVIAREMSSILLIDYKKIITTCSSACVFHTKLIQNMLKILASKNIMLTQKIKHITKHSIREKVLSYLSEQAVRCGRNQFTIPYNRQELADYLAVDRSALSSTLSKMRDEEILTFDKNRFELLKTKEHL